MSSTEETPTGDNDQVLIDKAREFLSGVLERMGIDAEIEVEEQSDKLVLEIVCEDTDRVIGKRGQVVDALQHLVGKVVAKDRVARGKPFVVDAGGYRDRHVERLQGLAERMREKALSSGAPVPLNPMSAHDRRIVHMQLAEAGDVTTESEGEGDDRHVVVIPTDSGAGATAD